MAIFSANLLVGGSTMSGTTIAVPRMVGVRVGFSG